MLRPRFLRKISEARCLNASSFFWLTRIWPPLLSTATLTIELQCGEDASGVLYALGDAGGGLACYMGMGHLIFEYNLMIIDRSIAKSAEKIAPGKHTIVVNTALKIAKPGAPADIVLSVDGKGSRLHHS